ncbi:MAG: hypothetical protein ACJ8EL_09285 [Rhizomicrobium sp.]
MRKSVLSLALTLVCVPLAACNQQQSNKQAVHERARGGHGLKKACAEDLSKYCAGQDRGRERRDCLQTHLDQLSADCKAAVSARGERGGGRRHKRDL